MAAKLQVFAMCLSADRAWRSLFCMMQVNSLREVISAGAPPLRLPQLLFGLLCWALHSESVCSYETVEIKR